MLAVLQWNAEGVSKKKVSLAERLHNENIDIACIQETHLTDNLRFTVRGYQTYRVDRQERHKGGVVILVRNNLPAQQITVVTDGQAEITGVDVYVQEKPIRIYNVYCPPDRDLSLNTMDITQENCLVLGDFNSHSPSWGYTEMNARGEEVEDWQIDTKLHLLNDPEDPPTYFSRRWLTSTTPDLAFITNNLLPGTERTVLKQLGGSDHKPVKITMDLNYHPEDCNTLPRWNYQKAKWDDYAILTDEYADKINTRKKDCNEMVKEFNKAVLTAAAETIPRGARKNYRPYWTEELQKLEDQVEEARTNVERDPTEENNIKLKATTAKYRKELSESARKKWQNKTEHLNLDRDGAKLWKLARAMNNEKTTTAPLVLEHEDVKLTGKQAADHLMNSYEEISNITVPEDQKEEVLKEMKEGSMDQSEDEVMSTPFTEQELEDGLKQLKKCKAPGPDEITNELLQNLGPQAKSVLLNIYNASWKNASVPQAWREATMIPIHKKGKDKAKADSYRPISLTSCVGKLMERLINTRMMWYLEKENVLMPTQAGFRHHRSTEDQVTYIAQEIEDALQDKKQTIAVWIDLEKAFDKVWKEGLKLKLQKSGIKGHMYEWICQYLNNRKAHVRNRSHRSRKKTLKHGVPQGGVLSPSLFIIFMNDVLRENPRWIHGAIYADDLVIWCSAEYLTTATVRIQEALRKLEGWTKRWLVSLNTKKTSYTIFSLSTRNQNTRLVIGGHALPQDKSPTYLGVTFDPRMTWKHQVDRCTMRARLRLALMKKLSGTSWGADFHVQRRLYTGRIRPVLEYGMAAWGMLAKTNFEKANRVQNQASRIMTGAIKSTPIPAMETLTRLQPLESRRDAKILTLSAKYKRLTDHPMHSRMAQPTKHRLKRGSFLHLARRLERQDPDLMEQTNVPIPTHSAVPSWKRKCFPEIRQSIPGIGPKDQQSENARRALTLSHINEAYPAEEWTHAYTDGSAENATRNGGGGVLIYKKDGTTFSQSMATGKFSTNYKAEAEALKVAADHIVQAKDNTHKKVVIFSDALSVLQALNNPKCTELNDLSSSLKTLRQSTEKTVLQWIPSHCNIKGNEEADRLAKEGSRQHQESKEVSYAEAKAIGKEKLKRRWLQHHPHYCASDAYYHLSRQDQVIMTRLRTGHSRLRHHMFTKFHIGDSPVCPCGAADMTVGHILQDCRTFQNLRDETWPSAPSVREKIFGSLEELRRTAAFIRATGIPV